ncbi:MAG TPA: 50S ribosomal protein L11 methyltransferase [Chloroflexota bacterium]
MIWVELSAEVEAEAVESVAEMFTSLGHGGVAVEEPLAATPDSGAVVIDPTRPVKVKTYIPDDRETEEKVRRAEEALWHLSQLRQVGQLQVNRLAEEDWAEAWKKFFFVQRVGERIVIKPSWRDYEPVGGDVVLELDPGMAFGTGLHPTTRMCLAACERLVQRGMRVLDLGTGSGILAIAAAKLGAASVRAVDVDPVAAQVAAKNVEMNGLSASIETGQGSIERAAPEGYDLVLANIIASVIIELASRLEGATAPGGALVVSGIIADREQAVRDALEAAGMSIDETIAEGDWRTMVCRHGRA